MLFILPHIFFRFATSNSHFSALTADDKLILCHDENFVRLALDKDDPLVHKNVRELTYREIMSLPLKSGARPVLLFDVLRSAHVIGGEAKMIVEIKVRRPYFLWFIYMSCGYSHGRHNSPIIHISLSINQSPEMSKPELRSQSCLRVILI
jgi:hypothetical protein